MIFSGSGGQGVITAAIIFAEAAVVYEGLNAVQSQSYGPEARGGASRSDVIIADAEIRYPKVIEPNVLVCLTQEAYNKFSGLIRPNGLLLIDSHFVKQEKRIDATQIELAMYKTVMEKIGRPIVFNICMLGALTKLTQLIKPGSIMKVLETRIPAGFLGINEQALEIGLKMAEDFEH
jgi:2-oxoglutarate ferredoxin oxidoreductase subunit gamma